MGRQPAPIGPASSVRAGRSLPHARGVPVQEVRNPFVDFRMAIRKTESAGMVVIGARIIDKDRCVWVAGGGQAAVVQAELVLVDGQKDAAGPNRAEIGSFAESRILVVCAIIVTPCQPRTASGPVGDAAMATTAIR